MIWLDDQSYNPAADKTMSIEVGSEGRNYLSVSQVC
jgi:hypothetical protein